MVSHLPAMLPVAVGMGLAFRIREERRVAMAWCGEGAAARGDAHEGMNLAGVRRLPVVFVIDNNQWAYSTPAHLGHAVEHLADRAAGYGFEGVVVDGTDVLAVYREAKRAIEKAREGGGPTLIESVTLRMEGHAVHDDASYVPREMFEEWARRDPIERFRTWLRDNAAMTLAEEDEISAGVKKLLNDSLARAEESPMPDPATLLDGVYATPRRARDPPPQVDTMAEKTYLQAISDGLRQEMRLDQRVFVLGEDVGVYGGAFKVTDGFQEEFGPVARARHAPLRDGDRRRRDRRRADGHAPGGRDAVRRLRLVRLGPPRHGGREAALPRRDADPDRAAAALGRRLLGRAVPLPEPGEPVRPHPRASRSSARRRRRTPRACSSARSPTRIPCSSSSTSTSTGGSRARCRTSATRRRSARRGSTAPGDDIVVVTWGAMVYTAEEAAEIVAADDISVEVLDLRTLIPWDREAVLESARRTSKVLVLHEDTRTGGFGAEIAATVAEEAFEHLDGPVKRIAAPDSPVPFSPPLEKAFIPQVDDVVAGLRELAAY